MDDRRARGAVFTPDPIARSLAEAALHGRAVPTSVCDPAAGDGRLLAAVAGRVAAPVRLFGADLAPAPGADPLGADRSVVRADTLVSGLATWPDAPAEGFELVIGNPPFRNQLEDATALTPTDRARLRVDFGDVAAGYADTASTFLVAACQMASPTGRIAMIMPLSFLSARDAGAARRRVLELASLVGIWVAGTQVFPDADVQVCALVLDRGAPRRTSVRRWVGPSWDAAAPVEVDNDALADAPTWSHLIAPLVGTLPVVELDGPGALGDLVTATAGFRGQFYGLAPHVAEVDGPVAGRVDGLAPMVTCGLIAPGRVLWGDGTTRIAGRRFTRPAIDPESLAVGSPLRRWVDERRRPKLVVATQTRVVEAASDPTGEWIPSTPVIAVHGAPDDLWRALAVLLGPPVTAWAVQRYAGAALSPTSIKLSASQVLGVPLPVDRVAWERAAAALADAHDPTRGGCPPGAVVAAAQEMTLAYGCTTDVVRWWRSRSGIL